MIDCLSSPEYTRALARTSRPELSAPLSALVQQSAPTVVIRERASLALNDPGSGPRRAPSASLI